MSLAGVKEYVHPSQAEEGENTEWLRFNYIPRQGLVYPERLCIEHPIAFDLILPGPTTVPLVRMLEEYSKLVPAFRDLVSISYLWCHSLGMSEISPTCLALLFVSFLQVRLASVFPPRLLSSAHRKPVGYPASVSPQALSPTTLSNSTTFQKPAANGQSTRSPSGMTNGRTRLWHWRRTLRYRQTSSIPIWINLVCYATL